MANGQWPRGLSYSSVAELGEVCEQSESTILRETESTILRGQRGMKEEGGMARWMMCSLEVLILVS